MYLLISTENNSHFSVAIGEQAILKSKTVSKPYKQTELLLKTISSLLPPTSYSSRRSSQAKADNLKAIFVVTGPGGFSAVRIGVSTANALAYALKIPVVGIQLPDKELAEKEKLNFVWMESLKKLKTKKVGDFAKPYYNQEPNITKKKD